MVVTLAHIANRRRAGLRSPAMRTLASAVILAAGLLACGPNSGGGDDIDAAEGNASLVVRLSAPTIRVDDGVVDVTPTVTALRVGADGSETDVTSSTAFAVEPGGFGAVSGATLVVSASAAGPGRVVGSVDGLAGDAPFEVFLTQTVPGTADPGAAGQFAGATLDPSQALTIAYPPAGAVVPPNLGEMDVHWTDPAGKDVYELTLSGGFVTLRTYVARLAASTYHTLAADLWARLSTGARGVELTVRVRGLASAAPTTFVEGSEALRIAAEDVRGGVYYWNTTQRAVMRYDMTTAAAPPERFYPPVGQTGCVGCHAVSRDGTVVAFRREGGNLNVGNAVAVDGLAPYLAEGAQQWNFAAIHPNNRDMFTTATDGLRVTDLGTGQMSVIHGASRISHPDVAPGGLQVVATELISGDEVWTSSGRLVVFDYDPTARTVGAPRSLVEPSGGSYPYYPSFSPDGQWVLFNRAVGGSSYDNRNAELWVVRADGSGAPVRLAEAEVAATYNSWPKWTPFVSHEPTATGGSETVLWLTVATRRPFGVRSVGTQAPQLWLAPFYPERAAAGLPASAPAVRLPFQVLAEGNHIAQWTETIVAIE